jgi:hypothetical protein
MNMISVAHAGVMSDAPRLSELVMNALVFVLSIAGALAVLMIVIAGIAYITAGGNTQRIDAAKKTLVGAVIGLSVVILSLIIVSTIVRLV